MDDVNSFKMRDWCLVWGLPLFVFLAISLLVSLMLGANFGNDNFVRGVIFLSCVFFLCIVYYLFQSFWVELFTMIWKRFICHKNSSCREMPKESLLKATEITENVSLPHQECHNDKREGDDLSITPEYPHSSEDDVDAKDIYAQWNSDYLEKQMKHKKNVIAAIIEYSKRTMAPYVNDDKELEKLCGEIQKWADDYKHTPQPISLKRTLTTRDLRHFIWNIGERIGDKRDYTGNVRAIFVKTMFPKELGGIELDSIRNFTFEPQKGNIKLDIPDEGDYAFHYDR